MSTLVLSPTTSKFEVNVFAQPLLIQEILGCPMPAWMEPLKSKRIFFIGIGTSYYAAQIAKCLWQQFVSADCQAIHSYDFVREPQPIQSGEVAVLFSHTGLKSFTLDAARLASQKGIVTIGITCKNSPWKDGLTYHLETCERENIGAFTKSLTSALAWIIRWINAPGLTKDILRARDQLKEGPVFPQVTRATDLILVGNLVGEWVAREIALKLQEAAYVKARAFGLEEFLHGPRISADKHSIVVAFPTPTEPRWNVCRAYLKTIRVPILEVTNKPSQPPGTWWLRQLFWGQRLTLDVCRQLGANPDTNRTDDPLYKEARETLRL